MRLTHPTNLGRAGHRLIDSVRRIAGETARDAAEVALDSQRLEQLAEHLTTLCGEFRASPAATSPALASAAAPLRPLPLIASRARCQVFLPDQ